MKFMVGKKSKPTFNVLNYGFFGAVKSRWRKPRGTHNKKRMKFKWAGAHPRIGYKNHDSVRGLHPSGMKEVLVHNLNELEGLKDVVLRVAGAVGAKKRALIAEKAKAMKLMIVNMREKEPRTQRKPKEKKTASIPKTKAVEGKAHVKPESKAHAKVNPEGKAHEVKPHVKHEVKPEDEVKV